MCDETRHLSGDLRYCAYWRRAAITLALLFGRVASAQQPTVKRADVSIVGCYRISLGPWSLESHLGPAHPTTVVRLDTIPRRPGLPGELVAERVEPTEFALPGDFRAQWKRPAHWRRVGTDSVQIISWSTGTEGEAFYGHWDGATLQGVVRRTSDAVPIDPVTRQIQWNAWPYAAASAVPAPCP